jgi:hypothetical protein
MPENWQSPIIANSFGSLFGSILFARFTMFVPRTIRYKARVEQSRVQNIFRELGRKMQVITVIFVWNQITHF